MPLISHSGEKTQLYSSCHVGTAAPFIMETSFGSHNNYQFITRQPKKFMYLSTHISNNKRIVVIFFSSTLFFCNLFFSSLSILKPHKAEPSKCLKKPNFSFVYREKGGTFAKQLMGDLEKQERVVVMVEEEEEEKERLLEGVVALDFDMLCSTVALRTAQGKWGKLGEEEEELEGNGGVLRMWEGELLDCFDDHHIAIESTCCPCYRFGKNMKRAGFGYGYIQAAVYFLLAIAAFLNLVAFAVTRRHCFLYLAVAFIVSCGTYLGFFRTRIRKKFNIKGSHSSLDDYLYHFACPCCTLCQESRTLEMNNVQDGTWHGRGDTICIGGFGEKSKALFGLHPPPIVSIKSTDESYM